MVKFIRRFHRPFMIGFAILSVITLSSFYSHTDFLEKGSGHSAEIYGHEVTLVQTQRMMRRAELSQQLGMRELYESLAVNRSDSQKNFIYNSMVLKHEADRLGLEPTEDEIFQATKEMPVFQTNGAYEPQKFDMITQFALTPKGFTTDDLGDLIGDDLRLKKIKALLGSTVAPSESELREAFTELNQKTEASVVRFKFTEFLAAAQVPEADVKKLFEERKDSLKTDELRKVKVAAFILPTTDKPLEGKARGEALTELQKKAEDFAVAMTEKDAKFEEVAAKEKVTVQESPDFPATVAPDVLGAAHQAAAAAYKLNEQQPNSDVIETPRGYYVIQLVKITPPRPLTYEEAKANLTDTLKRDRAQEALTLKATEIRNKIAEDMKGGKTFAAAAQTFGVKAEDFPPFSQKEPKTEPANAAEIMQAASELKEGQLSNTMTTSDGSVIVYVSKRLPVDEKQLEKDKGQLADGFRNFQRAALFQEWLKLRRAAAGLKEPNTRS